MGESIGSEFVTELGSSDEISGRKVSGKLEGSPLGESLCSDGGSLDSLVQLQVILERIWQALRISTGRGTGIRSWN